MIALSDLGDDAGKVLRNRLSRLLVWVVASAAVAPMSGCGAISGLAAQASSWTVGIYVAADNDLRSSALADLATMAGQLPAGVNVVVQADLGGHPGGPPAPAPTPRSTGLESAGPRSWSPADPPSWDGAARMHVTNGRFAVDETLGVTDMSRRETLTGFLSWMQDRYPSDRTALILWDHGSPWRGFGADSDSGSVLGLNDLSTALADAHGPRLDVIGFDSCLMASIEVAAAVAPHARYLVGSEETEAATGWDYQAMTAALMSSPDMEASRFASTLASDYASGLPPAVSRFSTVSVIDLDRVPATLEALAGLAAAIRSYLAGAPDRPERMRRYGAVFGRARYSAATFGRLNPQDSGASTDAGSYARNLAAAVPELADSANQLAGSVRDAVSSNWFGEGLAAQPPGGLSVLVPAPAVADADSADRAAMADYGRLAAMAPTGWTALATEWASLGEVEPGNQALRPRIVNLRASDAGITATAEDDVMVAGVVLTTTSLGSGRLMSMDELDRTYAAVNPVSAPLPSRVWALASGTAAPRPAFSVSWLPGPRVIFGQYRQDPGAQPRDAYAVFDLKDPAAGQLTGIFSDNSGIVGAVTPGPESTFAVADYSAGMVRTLAKPVPVAGVTLVPVELPAGQYLVGLTAISVTGAAATDGVAITAS